MDITYVIKKPLVTEKSTWAMNEQNRFSFEIHSRANKEDVKFAIEKIYKVKVEKVSTRVRRGPTRRYRYGFIQPGTKKFATVRLRQGDTIDLF